MNPRAAAHLVLPAIVAFFAGSVAQAQCEPEWQIADAVRGTDASIWAAATWDPDGPGPRAPVLVVGGDFEVAGSVMASHVAQWDGVRWSPLGAGVAGAVYAITTYDPDGAGPRPPLLVVAGSFAQADGFEANHVAAWDGTSWTALGDGVDGWVQALTTFDPDGDGSQPALLVAGGTFAAAGAVSAGHIAAWDGEQWLALGVGTDDNVSALASFDADGPGPGGPVLVAGGRFSQAGGVLVNGIASWNGASWSSLGTGVGGGMPWVTALGQLDPDGVGPQPAMLVAGGWFSEAGGHSANRIAAWNGTDWMPLGSGMTGLGLVIVYALTSFDPDGAGPVGAMLIAGGTFRDAGGVDVDNIAQWNGVEWLPLAGGMDSSVRAVTVFDADADGPAQPVLVAGGEFGFASNAATNHIASWDGAEWSSLGGGINARVNALTTVDLDGDGPDAPFLAMTGAFVTVGDIDANYVALWDGSQWSPLGSGLNANAFALVSYDADGPGPVKPVLVAGGSFSRAGGASAVRVAAWNGVSWSQFGSGMAGTVMSLATYDPDGDGPLNPQLIAGGEFVTAGGAVVNNIAAWDGSLWKSMGGGVTGRVKAMTTFDPDGAGPQRPLLIAAGYFTSAGGVPANSIAAWDGEHWHALSSGLGPEVVALTTFNPDRGGIHTPLLIAGGSFSTAGGVPVNGIAAWGGAAWSPIGSGVDGTVGELMSFDADGPGPQHPVLIVGGNFTEAGGQLARNIASWDASRWAPVGGDLNGPVGALVGYDRDGGGTTLFAGGSFSGFLARLGCAPCAADLDGDGQVDFADYLEFLNLYDAQDLAADFNQDGQVDFSDYLEFLNHYDAGC